MDTENLTAKGAKFAKKDPKALTAEDAKQTRIRPAGCVESGVSGPFTNLTYFARKLSACFLIRIEERKGYFASCCGYPPSFAGKFLIFAEKEQRAGGLPDNLQS